MTDASDRTAALLKLNLFAQTAVEPTLSDPELIRILENNKRASRWTTVTDYNVGDVVMPTVSNGHRYIVTSEGTSGATEPTWPDIGTVTNGDVEFEELGIDYTSIYDVRGALRDCWELKASKASEFISSSDSGSEQMIFQQCMRMVKEYSIPMVA